MSKSAKSSKSTNKVQEERQFSAITGASTKDAQRFLSKHNYRLDAAIDAYYNDPAAVAATLQAQSRTSQSSGQGVTTKLNQLFDKYKDRAGDNISVDGTIQFCQDLNVNPEDVVLLAVAYELKSPGVGEWTRKGWVDGWKSLGCDSLASIKTTLPRLRQKLAGDPKYFQQIYNYTFDFAKSEGQRSVSIDTAQAFWSLLLPHGLQGGALSHIQSLDGEDSPMSGAGSDDGWKPEYTQWWFEFLNERGGKGVSKDTWMMFLDFVRTVDSKFEKHDLEAAWPSTIDDFVEWARERIKPAPQ